MRLLTNRHFVSGVFIVSMLVVHSCGSSRVAEEKFPPDSPYIYPGKILLVIPHTYITFPDSVRGIEFDIYANRDDYPAMGPLRVSGLIRRVGKPEFIPVINKSQLDGIEIRSTKLLDVFRKYDVVRFTRSVNSLPGDTIWYDSIRQQEVKLNDLAIYYNVFFPINISVDEVVSEFKKVPEVSGASGEPMLNAD